MSRKTSNQVIMKILLYNLLDSKGDPFRQERWTFYTQEEAIELDRTQGYLVESRTLGKGEFRHFAECNPNQFYEKELIKQE